jgi:hypothetical protein
MLVKASFLKVMKTQFLFAFEKENGLLQEAGWQDTQNRHQNREGSHG